MTRAPTRQITVSPMVGLVLPTTWARLWTGRLTPTDCLRPPKSLPYPGTKMKRMALQAGSRGFGLEEAPGFVISREYIVRRSMKSSADQLV